MTTILSPSYYAQPDVVSIRVGKEGSGGTTAHPIVIEFGGSSYVNREEVRQRTWSGHDTLVGTHSGKLRQLTISPDTPQPLRRLLEEGFFAIQSMLSDIHLDDPHALYEQSALIFCMEAVRQGIEAPESSAGKSFSIELDLNQLEEELTITLPEGVILGRKRRLAAEKERQNKRLLPRIADLTGLSFPKRNP